MSTGPRNSLRQGFCEAVARGLLVRLHDLLSVRASLVHESSRSRQTILQENN